MMTDGWSTDNSEHDETTSIDAVDGSSAEQWLQELPFYGGIVKFFHDSKAIDSGCYYVTTPIDPEMDDIARYMSHVWHLHTPKIVLSVISGTQDFHAIQDAEFLDKFLQGLVKAANTTHMWVLTDGLDVGLSRLIGDVIGDEIARRQCLHLYKTQAETLPKLTLIGVNSISNLLYGSELSKGSQSTNTVQVSNDKQRPDIGHSGLNHDHTHFVLAGKASEGDNSGGEATSVEKFRERLIKRLLQPIGKARRYRRLASSTDNGDKFDESPDEITGNLTAPAPPITDDNTTPVVGMLINGGPGQLDHVMSLVTQQIPVIVLKGSGGVADLVSFAYEELLERSDKDHMDSYIKPELMKLVGDKFDHADSRVQYRDQILECVRVAEMGSQHLLTFISVTDWSTDLTNLNRYILMALFRFETTPSAWKLKEQLMRNLHLALDWNQSELADREIFHRYKWAKLKVENYLFESSLLRKNHERFVELFLDVGFLVHKYLSHKRLQYLFERVKDTDIFHRVCLETVLGQTVSSSGRMSATFLEGENCDLNNLLYKCTGIPNLVHPYGLSMNSLGSYVTDVSIAERRARNALVFWSALTNNHKLSLVLWRKTEEPIPLALIVSMLLCRLSKRCTDRDLRTQLKDNAREFGKLAVTLFEMSYNDSSSQALEMLSKRLPDFDNRTMMEIASMGSNKHLISHKCCQRWLVQRWNGYLQIRELNWGIVKLPVWFKIYSSVFLIFPMFIWISFLPESTSTSLEQLEEEEADDGGDKETQEKASLMEHMRSIEGKRKLSGQEQKLQDKRPTASRDTVQYRMSFCKKVYYLWSAPVTKFWILQLVYLIYLTVFTIATIWPACGNIILDLVVFFWTASLWLEIVRLTYVKKRKYPEMSIFLKVAEIIFISLFLAFHLSVRIVPHFIAWFSIGSIYTDYQSAKFVMSLGMLYFYYRMIAVFMPSSSVLGPMLINIREMVRNDLQIWFRMYLIFMISGAFTIQAVIYPNYPFTGEMIRKALSRALFALFLTKIDDLEADSDCLTRYPNVSLNYCPRDNLMSGTTTCAYGGWSAYLIAIQFLLIVKLVLVTLLFAMFSTTIAKISAESMQIWKFQRYSLIVEFEERLIFPAPLTIFSYAAMIVSALKHCCTRLPEMCKNKICTCCRKPKLDRMRFKSKIQSIINPRGSSDYNYWQSLMQRYMAKEKQAQAEIDRPKTQSNWMSSLMQDMTRNQKTSKKLNDRLVQVERGLLTCQSLLEGMKHAIERLDPRAQGLSSPTKDLLHVFARHPMYPETDVRRFSVLDKFVPWEVAYDAYDPASYTKSISEFSPELQKFVDPDMLLKLATDEDQEPSPEELLLRTFHPMWNAVCQVIGDKVFEVDRTSWVTFAGDMHRYRLAASGVPQNPLGRTGLKGRGSLWRWGPNHCIQVVVTRWKPAEDAGEVSNDSKTVGDGKRVMQFLVKQSESSAENVLPGGRVCGSMSRYRVVCNEFSDDAGDGAVISKSEKLDQDGMIAFFAQLDEGNGSGFSAQLLYKGYLDDPYNTDNAWLETEVWNLHYDGGDKFQERIDQSNHKWQDFSLHTRLSGSQADFVTESATVHGAYA